MREIVHLQAGQAGNQIGSKFWETIASEHEISANGVFDENNEIEQSRADILQENVNVYFSEACGSRYVPRAIMLDLEPSVLDSIYSSDIGALFKPDAAVRGASGAGNNWVSRALVSK